MIAAQGDLAVAVFVDEGESGSGTAGPILEPFLRAASPELTPACRPPGSRAVATLDGGDVLGHRLVVREGPGEGAGAVGGRAQVDRVADQLDLRHLGHAPGAVVADLVGAEQPAAAGGQVAHHACRPGRRGRAPRPRRTARACVMPRRRRRPRAAPARRRSGRPCRRSRRCAPCRRSASPGGRRPGSRRGRPRSICARTPFST